MKVRTLLCAALVLLPACEAPTVPARTNIYAFTTVPRFPGDPARVLRWNFGTRIGVYVAGGTGARETALVQAFEQAADAWNRVALYGEYHFERVSDVTDADVMLAWTDVTPLLDVSRCAPETGPAVTTFCLSADGRHLEPLPYVGIVQAVPRVRMLVRVLGNDAGLAAVNLLVAHELGHVLGIARHSPNPSDLMFASNTTAAPAAADAATVQVLYHVRADVTP